MLKKEQFILSGAADRRIYGDITYEDSLQDQPVLIFAHGFKGFKDWGAHNRVASWFAARGYRYVKFNFSHAGVDPQQPETVSLPDVFAANTISREMQDLDTVINFTVHTFPLVPVYLIGHSRGGGLTVLKGKADGRLQKIVTWSAIADFSSLWKKTQEQDWISNGRIYVKNARTGEEMPMDKTLLEDFRANRAAYDILSAAAAVRIPWLILHGDEDINVDFSVAQQLAQANPAAKLQKIAGANHVYGASHPYTAEDLPPQLLEVCEKTLAFLKE